MAKAKYTITTKGSRTIIHLEGKRNRGIAWPTNTGRYPSGQPKEPKAGGDRKPPRKKRKRR